MRVNHFQREIVRFLLGSSCSLCRQRSAAALCPACAQEVLHSLEAQAFNLPGLPVYALGRYEGCLRQALQGLKYQQAQELGWWLGVQLGKAWLQHHRPQQRHWVVPIPIHGDRLRQRGYNQAQLLAEGFCRVTGDRLVNDLLLRSRSTTALFHLSRLERQQEMQGAFDLKPQRHRPSAPPVLLMDDILTTGTTLLEAQQTLQRQDWPTVGAVVLALTPLSNRRLWHGGQPQLRKSAGDQDH